MSRNFWNLYDRLEYNSMSEKYFVERQSCQTVKSNWTRFLWFGALSWENCWVSAISNVLESTNWVVHAVSRIFWIGPYWWRTSRIRGDIFPGYHTGVTSGNPKTDGGKSHSVWTVRRSDHLHVNVQWHWLGEKRNKQIWMSNSSDVAAYAGRFPEGHWSFLGPETEEKWYGTHIHNPNGLWNEVAELMMINLRASRHPLFRGRSALFRGALKSKGSGKLSIHYNADPATVAIVISNNNFRQSTQ